MVCFRWLNDPKAATHSPTFPSEQWEVLTSEEFEVGPAEIGTRGTARCRGCGRVEPFDCGYPEGYFFPARDDIRQAWSDAVQPR